MKFNKHLKDIQTYEAGKPIELVVREFGINDVIKLASNENPRGCSERVKKEVRKHVENMSLYPDDSMFELKQGLSKKFKVDEKNIIIGSGSDQIIEFAVGAKGEGAILTSKITFAMYEIYAKQKGLEVIKTPSKEHNLEDFKNLYKLHEDKLSIIFLCIPNNPLGECLDKKAVYDFIKGVDENILVVIDGAYQEYAAFKDKSKKINPKNLIKTFPNVLYLGTFSKAFGLGGMRIGYGIANENIIKNLYKLRPPFNITTLSLKAANEALKDEKFVQKSLKENLNELKKYEKFADKLKIEYIPSFTNFITFLFDDKKSSAKISDLLLKKGIIVRNLNSYGLNGIRVTIGTKMQNRRFFETFKRIYE